MNHRLALVFWMLSWPTAFAQCPAGITNTLQLLVGKWTYSVTGVVPALSGPLASEPFIAAGQFVASFGSDRNGNPRGVLAIAQSSNRNGQVTRLESDAGTYQIFPDCSG